MFLYSPYFPLYHKIKNPFEVKICKNISLKLP